MTIDQIHYEHDLNRFISECVQNKDADALMDVKRVVENWLQPEYETSAQLAMIDAIIELIFESE